LQVLAAELGMKVTVAELDSAMTEVNPDGSAEVGFEKFEAWWKGGQKRSACMRMVSTNSVPGIKTRCHLDH
jgi:hypothetical protein